MLVVMWAGEGELVGPGWGGYQHTWGRSPDHMGGGRRRSRLLVWLPSENLDLATYEG